MSFILMTTLFYKALLLQGEIWCWSLLGLKQGSYPFLNKNFKDFSRMFKDTHFLFFKDSIQCKKEIWVYVFFSSTTTWAILSWRSFILGTWESGLDKVSTEIQGLSSNDCNFQGLSRPWTFYFKFQGLSTTFKVRANPVKGLINMLFLFQVHFLNLFSDSSLPCTRSVVIQFQK